MSSSLESDAGRPSWAALALGLFIVWQLAFLVVGNAAGYLAFVLGADDPNPVQQLAAVSEAWSTLTGQGQSWRMFAPNVPPRSLFLQVQLQANNSSVPIGSEFEHPAGDFYLDWSGAGDRLWGVEKTLAFPLLAYDAAAIAERPQEWRDYLSASMHNNQRFYRSYLSWQRREYRRQHPGAAACGDGELGVRIYELSQQGRTSAPIGYQTLLRDEQSDTAWARTGR
jgi:hypothetical protein